MDVPRGTRPARRDAFTAQFEQQVQAMRQQSNADRERIASLKAAQRDMQQFISQFIVSWQSVGQPSSGGDESAGENNDEA